MSNSIVLRMQHAAAQLRLLPLRPLVRHLPFQRSAASLSKLGVRYRLLAGESGAFNSAVALALSEHAIDLQLRQELVIGDRIRLLLHRPGSGNFIFKLARVEAVEQVERRRWRATCSFAASLRPQTLVELVD